MTIDDVIKQFDEKPELQNVPSPSTKRMAREWLVSIKTRQDQRKAGTLKHGKWTPDDEEWEGATPKCEA